MSRYADDEGMVLDPVKVPEDLRDLIPLAKKWAIGDEVERDVFERLASFEEKKEFIDSVWPRMKRIEEFCAPLRGQLHETYEDVYEAVNLGYSYIQGFFFCKPRIIFGKDLPS